MSVTPIEQLMRDYVAKHPCPDIPWKRLMNMCALKTQYLNWRIWHPLHGVEVPLTKMVRYTIPYEKNEVIETDAINTLAISGTTPENLTFLTEQGIVLVWTDIDWERLQRQMDDMETQMRGLLCE